MTWFKVDDTLAFHPKVLAAGNAAMGLWVRAGSWSAQQLKDGFVPDSVVATLDGKTAAKKLEEVGLWHRVDGGWQFHGWQERQPTREQVELHRERERRKKARQRAHGAAAVDRDEDTGRFVSPGDNQGDTPGDSRGVSPATRPDPTRPITESRKQPRINRTDVLAAAADIVLARRDVSDKSRSYIAAAARGIHNDLVAWATTRTLDGLTAQQVADEFEPPPGPKLREVNGRMCQHIPGTGFVPVQVTA